ncbi:TraR/DksA family transcriptional regulator [Nonomuraea soli]|uniref:DnaK suppressor protein n=1 Tax=Nonomuraea soli TaxID=1032476 RepID=A0A7W0CDI4_9ACTN|nr:TraR/DksA C4-type zinc finger protein [Nonomuraea soli]MBA2889025.1 DnaK suppressor protein [Nonomuraea soli]
MPKLGSVQIQTLREALEEQLRWRIAQLAELKVTVAGISAEEPTWQDAMSSIAAADQAIAQTEESLDRLAAGTYGTCHDCEADIAFERLKVRPLARFCMDCQRRRERW